MRFSIHNLHYSIYYISIYISIYPKVSSSEKNRPRIGRKLIELSIFSFLESERRTWEDNPTWRWKVDATGETALDAVELSSTWPRGIRWKNPRDTVPRLWKACPCATRCPIPGNEILLVIVEAYATSKRRFKPEEGDEGSLGRTPIAWMSPPIWPTLVAAPSRHLGRRVDEESLAPFVAIPPWNLPEWTGQEAHKIREIKDKILESKRKRGGFNLISAVNIKTK